MNCCFGLLFMMIGGQTPANFEGFQLPVRIEAKVTPDERIKFRYFSVWMIPMERDDYFEQNPGYGMEVPFDEDIFRTRRYKKKYKYSSKNKKKGDFSKQFAMELPAIGEYVVYLFFEEISWLRKKNVSRITTNRHYAIQTLWYDGKCDMNLSIVLEEVETQEALAVTTEISMNYDR